MKSCMSVMDLPFCSWSDGNVSSSGVSMAPILGGLYPPTEVSRDVNPFLNTRRRDSPTSPGENPLSTPSPAIEMSKHQDYPLPHPVPKGKTGNTSPFIVSESGFEVKFDFKR